MSRPGRLTSQRGRIELDSPPLSKTLPSASTSRTSSLPRTPRLFAGKPPLRLFVYEFSLPSLSSLRFFTCSAHCNAHAAWGSGEQVGGETDKSLNDFEKGDGWWEQWSLSLVRDRNSEEKDREEGPADTWSCFILRIVVNLCCI